MATEQKLPLFQPFATASEFLSPQEMDQLIAEHAASVAEAKLGPGNSNAQIRRSQVLMLGPEPRYQWLYQRIWVAAQECNRWHTDFAGIRPLRKLSISIQLSAPEDYEGGDLELLYGHQPEPMARARGAFIVFPSFMLHRVTPVTRGTRWSLVAWILGTRWR
jgi:PKHD-type hydroxylase